MIGVVNRDPLDLAKRQGQRIVPPVQDRDQGGGGAISAGAGHRCADAGRSGAERGTGMADRCEAGDRYDGGGLEHGTSGELRSGRVGISHLCPHHAGAGTVGPRPTGLAAPAEPQNAYIIVRKNPDMTLYLSSKPMSGLLAFERGRRLASPRSWKTMMTASRWWSGA